MNPIAVIIYDKWGLSSGVWVDNLADGAVVIRTLVDAERPGWDWIYGEDGTPELRIWEHCTPTVVPRSSLLVIRDQHGRDAALWDVMEASHRAVFNGNKARPRKRRAPKVAA